MRIFSLLCPAAAIAAALMLPGPAFAKVLFCSQLSRDIFVSIAYKQQGDDASDVSYLTRGWLSVHPGKCYYFDTALVVPKLFFRMETDWYTSGRKKTQMIWPGDDDQKFWVQDSAFQFYHAENADAKPTKDARYVPFGASLEDDSGDLSETVTINEDGSISQTIASQQAPPVQTPPVQPPATTTSALDGDGQKLFDAFLSTPPNAQTLSGFELQLSKTNENLKPQYGQAEVTYGLQGTTYPTQTDLTMRIFADETSAAGFLGGGDMDAPYAKEVPDSPGALTNFGHTVYKPMPDQKIFWLWHLTQAKDQIWFRCLTQVGRVVIISTTLEPVDKGQSADTLPDGTLERAVSPLLAGLKAGNLGNAQ
ncbi:MAG: DUF1036 domain-containing protein [Rhizobiaceae bacterium]|nr:DUF1036 domain-containing protein [Rhizobiaceae bacterium]